MLNHSRIIILIASGVALYNIYYETNILKRLKSYSKYYKMFGIILFAIGALQMSRNTPAYLLMEHLDVAKSIVNGIPPSSAQSQKLFSTGIWQKPREPFQSPRYNPNTFVDYSSYIQQTGINKNVSSYDGSIMRNKKTKRSVSETKKKHVASLQNWRCKHCNKQLNAWFEVDHKIRLEDGGTNDFHNLEALCRECHGYKTAMENM